jgi:hypothetical protein
VKGIGRALLCFLSRIAIDHACDQIWGEATSSSSDFYRRFFELDQVKDLFVIPRDNVGKCANRKLDWLRCSPPLPEQEVKSIAASIGRYEPGSTTTHGRNSQATKLVVLASNLELFHTAEMEAFASYEVDDHFETWRLRVSVAYVVAGGQSEACRLIVHTRRGGRLPQRGK